MTYETANLQLDGDGSVWRIVPLGEEERDFELIGDVDRCAGRVPDHLEDEFEELCGVWAEWVQEDKGYRWSVASAWDMAKGR